jgi:hypothetical protein
VTGSRGPASFANAYKLGRLIEKLKARTSVGQEGGRGAASAMVAFRQLGYLPLAQQQIGRVKSAFEHDCAARSFNNGN